MKIRTEWSTGISVITMYWLVGDALAIPRHTTPCGLQTGDVFMAATATPLHGTVKLLLIRVFGAALR